MSKLLVLVTLLASAGTAAAGTVRHVPPAETTANTALEIDAEVAHAWDSTLTLHYRPIADASSWTAATFARKDGDVWAATVPAAAVVWPGVEYYIDAVGPDHAAPAPEFASADAPHQVRIKRTRAEVRKERDLAQVGGRRSRVHVAAEYVDFGAKDVAGHTGVPDNYYRIDTDFAYRLLAYPLEQIRFGYTRLIGDTPAGTSTASCGTAVDCKTHVGFKVGGWFELRFGIAEGIAVDARGMVMATSVGFGVGGGAELRFGVEDGNHVAFGVESIQDIGTTGHFRLGWATVPKLPMAASVEVTNMPSGQAATAVRFLYDVAYPVMPGVRIGGRVGYAARTANVGGLSAGANLTLDF